MSALHTQPHRGNLGDLGPLIAALSPGTNVLAPAAVLLPGRGYLVLAGERRVAARQAQGKRSITLHVVRTWREFYAWLLIDTQWIDRHPSFGPDASGVAVPMNIVDAAWWMDKVESHLKTTRNDMHQRVLAEYVGLPIERIRDVKYQFRWLQDEDEAVRDFAQKQLRYVAQGVLAGTSAGERIKRFAESRTTVAIGTQRAILASASSHLAGLADTLRPLAPALSDELTDQEIDAALKHLTEGRLQTERVIRALKAIKERRPA